jgi:serine/threonine protein kinase
VNTAPSLPSLVGTVLGDSYRIVRQVGQGGMGELYEATHLRLAGRYAIKVLLPQFAAFEELIARFQREAEITSSLRHPNIVSVFDFNTTVDGRAFLAMEFLEGHDLGLDLEQRGPMSLGRTIEIVGQVVSALSAAHAHGVVHRDLKPQNLFISALPGDQREIVKILDFGISKMREAPKKITREHAIIGTPQYMAPEQAMGDVGATDHRTDQFALGAIAYELLAGRAAFDAAAIEAIIYQVVHEAPKPLRQFRPDVPANVERVLLRALAKQPDQRYPDIGSFGQALVAAADAAQHAMTPTLVAVPPLGPSRVVPVPTSPAATVSPRTTARPSSPDARAALAARPDSFDDQLPMRPGRPPLGARHLGHGRQRTAIIWSRGEAFSPPILLLAAAGLLVVLWLIGRHTSWSWKSAPEASGEPPGSLIRTEAPPVPAPLRPAAPFAPAATAPPPSPSSPPATTPPAPPEIAAPVATAPAVAKAAAPAERPARRPPRPRAHADNQAFEAPAAPLPDPELLPPSDRPSPPPATGAAPAANNPALIEDVDDAPAEPAGAAKPSRAPLIEEP